MSVIHFLNVREGDCSIIQHNSRRVTVIDVCNANQSDSDKQMPEKNNAIDSLNNSPGKFQQKKYPVNPIDYLQTLDDKVEIFRYIQTHPDMDHMDGIKDLFTRFPPTNFWDTENKKEVSNSWDKSLYNKKDWDFYRNLRDDHKDPKRLTLLAGAEGKYYNQNEDGMGSGDGIQILAPTKELVDAANENKDYNDCSYVLLYSVNGKQIVFGGDSHDDTWNHILKNYKDDVTDIDLLIAPHHGRKSKRSYEFLDVLKPTITFFGNARSQDLAYDAWNRKKLDHITNNEANCMIVDINGTDMRLYVTNKAYAEKINPNTWFETNFNAWFARDI